MPDPEVVVLLKWTFFLFSFVDGMQVIFNAFVWLILILFVY